MANTDWKIFKEQHKPFYYSRVINNGSRPFYDFVAALLYYSPGNVKAVLRRYTLSIIVSGRGRYSDESGNEKILKPGTVLERVPGIAFAMQRENDDDRPYIEAMFNLTSNMYRCFHDTGFLKAKTSIYEVDINRELFNDIITQIKSLGYDNEDCLTEWLCGFVSMIKKLRSNNQSNKLDWRDELVSKVQKAMRMNLADIEDISSFASDFNLSSRYLRKIFQEKTGESPKNYYLKLKFEYACRLLIEDKLSIKEIAFELGYSYPQSFCRQFKAFIGCSPSDYRKNSHGE